MYTPYMPRLETTLVLAVVVGAWVAGEVTAQTPSDGREVMQLYQTQDRTRDLEMTLDLTLVDPRGRERRRSLLIQSRTDSGLRKQLIRFLSPGDIEGTGFLTIENETGEDDAWLYLPALRRTRRIAGADKQDRFVGTDFTFEDLEQERLAEHAYELIGDEVVGGVEAWLVRAEASDPARREETGYGWRELWVSKARHIVVQAKLYDRSGAYVRRLEASDVRQVPGTEKWRAYRLTMEDVRERRRTVLSVAEYRIDQGVSEALFTERYLRRGR